DLVRRFRLPPERVPVVPLAVPAALATPPAATAVDAFRSKYGLGQRLVARRRALRARQRRGPRLGAVEGAAAAAPARPLRTRGRGAERGWELVIAGRLRLGYAPPWLRALPAGVRWLGALDDGELSALYAAARVAVSASDYEGFGLTVLEAMAGGCAVVAVAVT